MSAKIISFRGAALLLAFALALTGCKPTGNRALLRGKKYLDRGDYAAAVTQFKTATTLLATNAAAWNYYGVALEHAAQPIEAANAYQRALELDRDYSEARLNLGTLWLEQNRPEDAKTEFTAYTLRWPNDPVGWLKLGYARLKLGEVVPAERSFSTVLSLKTNLAEAYNGLGMARIQRGKPQEAAQFFAAAVQLDPNYAAAQLNLATVNHEYLHNDQAALEHYRAWLALVPRPANWDEVKAIADALEKGLFTVSAAPAVTPQPRITPASAPVPVRPEPKPVPAPSSAVAESRPAPKPTTPAAPVSTLQSPRAQSAGSALVQRPVPAPTPTPVAPTEVVQVPTETAIVTRPSAANVQTAATPPTRASAPAAAPVAAPPSNPPAKPGLWSSLFGSSGSENSGHSSYAASGVTPLPGATPTVSAAPTPTAAPKPRPIQIIPPTPVYFPRYHYLYPRPSAAGDRAAASRAFAQARQAEQSQNWSTALGGYRSAASLDPAWFEAQYNAGVLAQRLGNYSQALASYETALALQPDSVNARYNFALTLKAAGYVPDAAEELKKILADNPREVRAHLALANLCAQQLHDPAQAREHYLKVLELDPRNSEAANIRFWLAANPLN